MGILDLLFPKTCLGCGSEGKYICASCLAKVGNGGAFQNNISIFRYEGVIRKAIIALKYKYSTEIAKELADVCVKKLKFLNLVSNNYCLVPIPLHWRRFNERGFNQSEEVGGILALKMGWKFEPNLLIKNKSTKTQVGLKGDSRRKNLTGVFSVNPDSVLSTLHSVLVFDDVYTTGATLGEAKKTLEAAGFKNILGLTIAKD